MDRDLAHDARLLIVDDEFRNIRLLVDLLEQADYKNLKTTTDSREAVTLYQEYEPDLVLLDLMMPHVDGYQVLTRLRELIPKTAFVPILVLTADTTSQARRKALLLGANDFLSKPFDIIEVHLRIRNLLQMWFLHLELQRQNESLEQAVKENTGNQERAESGPPRSQEPER